MMERSSQKTTKTVFVHALKMLQRREYSAHELTQKLTQRSFALADINAALSSLQEQNLQSDARFSEQYIHSRLQRGYGPVRIVHELRIRGVAMELIDSQLEQAQIDWPSQAKAVRIKRFGEAIPDSFPDRAKQLRFMENRGFGQQLKALFEED